METTKIVLLIFCMGWSVSSVIFLMIYSDENKWSRSRCLSAVFSLAMLNAIISGSVQMLVGIPERKTHAVKQQEQEKETDGK